MLLTGVLFVYFQCRFVTAYQYAKPVAQTLWPQRCGTGERILNDCNWCRCNKHAKFICSARVCDGVDMFGHFNDVIQNYEVGMEGHGVWRSGGLTKSACTPGMHYQREGLLCVCDSNGNWPSPVCRDLFQVLHGVEVTGHERPSALHECERDKLYLYGCNVCFCPVSGRIDPEVCTKNNCTDDDPILQNETEINKNDMKFQESEVYAECELNRKYVVGCRKCICLKNNRLLCDNCEKDEQVVIARADKEVNDYCKQNSVAELFSIDCNICICDQKGVMYCTTRKCLREQLKPNVELRNSDMTLRTVDPPIDASDCAPGTKYKIDCNICFCSVSSHGVKALSCTMKHCNPIKELKASDEENEYHKKTKPFRSLNYECVENTVYESSCTVCRCDVVDGMKRESCLTESHCMNDRGFQPKSFDLNDLHGYCEPAHIYRRDCNTCKCLKDGKTVACSARVCPAADATAEADAPAGRTARARAVYVDVVPVTQSSGGAPCPRDHMYRVDCNFCFCLTNGNLLCTTADCGDQ